MICRMIKMNQLPLCLEEIILDYKYQLETTDKYKKVLQEIKGMHYSIIGEGRTLKSIRNMKNKKMKHYYTYGITNFLMSESISHDSFKSVYIECGFNISKRRYTTRTFIRGYFNKNYNY